jgi:hypothetical protein
MYEGKIMSGQGQAMLQPFYGSPLFWNAAPEVEDEGGRRYLCLPKAWEGSSAGLIPVEEKLFIVPISYQTWGLRLPITTSRIIVWAAAGRGTWTWTWLDEGNCERWSVKAPPGGA